MALACAIRPIRPSPMPSASLDISDFTRQSLLVLAQDGSSGLQVG